MNLGILPLSSSKQLSLRKRLRKKLKFKTEEISARNLNIFKLEIQSIQKKEAINDTFKN